jgi:hypothetical protein
MQAGRKKHVPWNASHRAGEAIAQKIVEVDTPRLSKAGWLRH